MVLSMVDELARRLRRRCGGAGDTRACVARTEKNTRTTRAGGEVTARSRCAFAVCVAKLCGIVARRRSAVNPLRSVERGGASCHHEFDKALGLMGVAGQRRCPWPLTWVTAQKAQERAPETKKQKEA